MTSFLASPITILLLSQGIFTATDLLGRYGMSKSGSFVTKLIQPWMILFLLGHLIASIGQLYVFSKFEVGKTVALFGAVSIVTASVLGYLLLHETLSVTGYIGIMIAVTAFLVLVYR